ncbi:sensor histidine kinase [Devosia sp. 919]|uniref:sensor histidine kinase n=1 Tax=Devosia sp. 919 TaxID=2726065 RepID=UPI0015537AB5|nr:sensor histidine kinase [Devosia sp. 919]
MTSYEQARLHDGAEAVFAQLVLSYADANHRIANSLQLLVATLQRQVRSVSDELARAALVDAYQRLTAVGTLHRLLAHSGSNESLMLDEFLERLVEALRDAWTEPSSRDAVRLSCVAIALPKVQVIQLAMIISELVCNSLKYAYPPDAVGDVRISVTLEHPASLLVSVEDDGFGFGNSPVASGAGTGRQLIQSIAANLPASLEQHELEVGTRVQLRLDLPLLGEEALRPGASDFVTGE